MKAFARRSVLAAVWLAAPLLMTACQSQAEGERCDFQNGAADCASGLTCGPSNKCCVPGTSECNALAAPSTSDGATNTPGSDAATEGSSTMTGDAATHDAATHEAASNEAASNEAASNEAATMSSETGAEGGIVTDAADGAAE
jgi:hypothetical protein